MMYFVFEALARMGEFEKILELTRTHWGFMLDQGATTCWETFPNKRTVWTRSHCHAWSAAPTYFLSAYQLGVRPLGPGFRTALIAPVPAGLAWARGRIPTPHGVISVAWQRSDERFNMTLDIPEGVRAEIEIPPAFPPDQFPRVSITTGAKRAVSNRRTSRWVITAKAGPLVLEVGK